MDESKKVDCLVKLVWSAEQNMYEVAATGRRLICPIPASALLSVYAEGMTSMALHNMLVAVANVAVKSAEPKPNAYTAVRAVSDVHGRAYDGAPFEDVFAFQLFRIPDDCLSDPKIHELGALTAYRAYANVK